MKIVRRIRLWALPFAVAIGAFALPFGTVTACGEQVKVTGFELVGGKLPAGKPVVDAGGGNGDSTPEDAIAQRGGGLVVAAFALALIGLGVGLRRGRSAAVVALGAAAGGALALWELALRGREEADAFVVGNGIWVGLGAFGAAGVIALASALWRLDPRRIGLGNALGCVAVAALAAGTILPFLHIRSSGDSSGFSLVDFVSPAAGRTAVWLGLEAVVLVLAAALGLLLRRGGFLVGLGGVSLAGHTAMIVGLLRSQSDEETYSFTLGSGLLLSGSLLLLLAGLALARAEAGDGRSTAVSARLGLLAGGGLAAAAAFLAFDEGGTAGDRQVPLHLHDFPLPLAYGAAPFAVAAVAVLAGLAARRSGRVLRGMLIGIGLEALLIFAGAVYTLFISRDDGSPGTGLYVGLAAGALLLASALAAAVTKPGKPALR